MSTPPGKHPIKKMPVFKTAKELVRFLEDSFSESLKQLIRVLITTIVKEEMEQIREEYKTNNEKLYFNGYYDRNLTSAYGQIKGIPIPRFREGFQERPPQSFAIFEEEYEKFKGLIEQMHLLGISQRKIKKLVNNCFGVRISTTRTGHIYRELAEKEEVNINSQRLEDEFEYLLLDGIWEKTKGYGWENNKSVLLCALGIRADGTRKVIGFNLARKEDNESWRTFVASLKARGLSGKSLKLIIADDTAAIKNAVGIAYASVPVQICIAHKMRNVLAKTKARHKQEMADDLKIIFAAKGKEAALETAQQVAKKWYVKEPAAIESLRFNFEYCLSYFAFPEELWKKIRTTNILEREFREVRRRIKVFDNTFQHERSTAKYANSIFSYLNDNYPAHQALHTDT